MSTARINRGQEFLGHHPLVHKANSPHNRAHIRHIEDNQLTVEQFYATRTFGTMRAIGHTAWAALQIVREFAENTLDKFVPDRAAQLATAQVAEITEATEEAA